MSRPCLVRDQNEGVPSYNRASRWETIKTRLREAMGRFLNRRRVAGAVQPINFNDPLTGNHIEVVINPLFTVLSVNGRDYYFKRLTGRFDGTGESSQLSGYTPVGTLRLAPSPSRRD